MEKTLVSETGLKRFQTGTGKSKKEITVEPRGDLYKVTCVGIGGWRVTKILSKRKAAWFILRCTQRRTKTDLASHAKRGRIRALLVGENMKMSGVEWISIRMVHGARPIILKAPALFRQRLIYIEPSRNGEMFNLRIVDPLSEHRTAPIEIGREEVDAAIKVFGENQDEHHDKEINQSAR